MAQALTTQTQELSDMMSKLQKSLLDHEESKATTEIKMSELRKRDKAISAEETLVLRERELLALAERDIEEKLTMLEETAAALEKKDETLNRKEKQQMKRLQDMALMEEELRELEERRKRNVPEEPELAGPVLDEGNRTAVVGSVVVVPTLSECMYYC